jgi:asparagine synthase (glutamine-hydrolysing)
MCGVIALFTTGAEPEQQALQRGLARLMRRGPDAEGVWRDAGVLLGHRRLAIQDLDPRANQPFQSACGRYVIVFNGEIYNFSALRSELRQRGLRFRTTSDTEVLLELFRVEGAAMLTRLHGMFAFAIWDIVQRRAFMARDPYGIKPLYYTQLADGVMVASQVKSLVATGLVSRAPDLQAQAGFWMLGSVAEPRTWYRDVRSVPAGGYLWVHEGRVQEEGRWCDVSLAWRTAPTDVRLSQGDAMEVVREALRESVRRHLIADVPVGVFLSGGIDSTALAALMSEAGTHDVQGVTLTYDEFAGRHEDEAPVAAQVARFYGITHHVRRVTHQEFEEDIQAIVDAVDQPSIDGVNSWYATKAVAEAGLKVVVSGVGGDELFLGYESFRQIPQMHRLWRMARLVPGATWAGRMAGAMQARRTGNPRWRLAAEWTRTIEGCWWLRRSIAAPEELPWLMGREQAIEALRDFDVQRWIQEMCGPLSSSAPLAIAQMESMGYLRNQLLRDSDWASMAHSVELRTPLVDAHLLTQLVPCMRHFDAFPGKALLAQAPNRALPQVVTRRRKTGFGIPVQQWTNGGRGTPVTGYVVADGPRLSGWAGWMRQVVEAYEG